MKETIDKLMALADEYANKAVDVIISGEGSAASSWKSLRTALEQALAAKPDGMAEFLADLERSRAKYPNNARMFDGLMGEVDELRRAYAGDGDVRAEAFDVAVCAFRIATEGDAGGNSTLAAKPEGEPLLTCDIEPRPLSHSLRDYHTAMTEGPLHFTWVDKPHRLVYDLIAAVRYYAAPPARVDGWQPIETAPKDGRTVLLGYHNSHGKWRTMRGQWMSQEYIDENFEEPDMATPGWYETSVEADDIPSAWFTEPTHWMPLPPAPQPTKD
jgi:hypothetical protein